MHYINDDDWPNYVLIIRDNDVPKTPDQFPRVKYK